MKKIALLIGSLLLLLVLAITLVRSEWGQEQVRELLTRSLKKGGFEIEFKEIEGTLPNLLHLEEVTLRGNGLTIQIHSIDFEISLLRLLKREIYFNELNADQISWIGDYAAGASASKKTIPISVEKLQLTHLQIPNSHLVNLKGKLEISSKRRKFDLAIESPDFPNTIANLHTLVQSNGTAQIRGELKSPNLQIIGYPYNEPLDLYFSARGPWNSVWVKGFPFMTGKIRGTLQKWSFSSQFDTDGQGILNLTQAEATGPEGTLKGKASFNQDLKFQTASIAVQTSSLPYELEGRIAAYLNLRSEGDAIHAKGSFQSPKIAYHQYESDKVKGTIDAAWENQTIKGSTQISSTFYKAEWELATDFSWSPGGSLFLPAIELKGPVAKGNGNLELQPDQIWIGTTELKIENVQGLNIPQNNFYGNLLAKGEWKRALSGEQFLHIDAAATDFYYGNFHAQKGTLYSDLTDPFHKFKGEIYLDFEKILWGSLELESASIETNNEGEIWPYKLFAEGRWKHPLELKMSGFWRFQSNEFFAEVQKWEGSFFNNPFILAEPFTIEWKPDEFHLSPMELSVANAKIIGTLERKAARSDAHFQLEQLPLDFLSLNPLDVSIKGKIDLDAILHEENDQLKGTLSASIDQMEIASRENERLLASGAINGTINRDRLDLEAHLNVNNTPLLTLSAILPIHLSLFPFQAKLHMNSAAKGDFAFDGKVEDILDFLDLGTHRFEGEMHGKLHFSNTLGNPMIEGKWELMNGLYQNYYTGTEIRNLQAVGIAEQQSFHLQSFTGEDPKGGTVSASGEIHLADPYPFRFDTDLNQFQFVDLDLVASLGLGKVQIKGNRESATATGTIELTQSTIYVPDHIPKPLPNLQVVYKNALKPTPAPELEIFHLYPLYLDVHVLAPKNISITGRGLDSEWKGDFQIGGTWTEMATKGKLELIDGTFTFSSRSFKLTDGSLSLSGKAHEMPYLNLSAGTEEKGIAITAHLSGPLNNPQLTFRSVPPLPLSSIMSYLLFGQDLSEISGFQALQLATSIASIAGEGPDILESTRRSLGLDRLRIVSAPHPEIEGETISIQAGKYVAEGVIVSISQGAEDSSTNASIEVEIKDNFVFQAETDQKQEQGKFTIKWTLNY